MYADASFEEADLMSFALNGVPDAQTLQLIGEVLKDPRAEFIWTYHRKDLLTSPPASEDSA